MRNEWRAPLIILLLVPATACVLFVHAEAGGDHCMSPAASTDCVACLVDRCQEAVDACCFPGTCSDLLSTFEQCGRSHDASCTAARARVDATDATESRLATCAASRCGTVCNERSGTSTTLCKESHLGQSACSCSVTQPANDVDCSEASEPGAVCCASKGWPGASLSCSCAPFVCVPAGGGCFCSLNEYAPEGYEAKCGGVGLTCCTFNGTCQCGTTACTAPQIEVSACSRDMAGCGEGLDRVPSCSVRSAQ